jgi:hypothetical protein
MERQERKCFLPKLVETAEVGTQNHGKRPPVNEKLKN